MKKNFLLIILAFAIISCGSRKEAQYESESGEKTTTSQTEEVEKVVMEKGQEISEGIIRDKSNDEACGFLIEVELNGEKVLLEPLKLSEEFKVDGKAVKLQYSMSRRASKCTMAIPIVIDKISA